MKFASRLTLKAKQMAQDYALCIFFSLVHNLKIFQAKFIHEKYAQFIRLQGHKTATGSRCASFLRFILLLILTLLISSTPFSYLPTAITFFNYHARSTFKLQTNM